MLIKVSHSGKQKKTKNYDHEGVRLVGWGKLGTLMKGSWLDTGGIGVGTVNAWNSTINILQIMVPSNFLLFFFFIFKRKEQRERKEEKGR